MSSLSEQPQPKTSIRGVGWAGGPTTLLAEFLKDDILGPAQIVDTITSNRCPCRVLHSTAYPLIKGPPPRGLFKGYDGSHAGMSIFFTKVGGSSWDGDGIGL